MKDLDFENAVLDENRKIFLFIILVIKYHKSLRVTYHDIN